MSSRAASTFLIQWPWGKIICLSWNNIPQIVWERGEWGGLGLGIPPSQQGAEDLFILEQGWGTVRGTHIAAVHVFFSWLMQSPSAAPLHLLLLDHPAPGFQTSPNYSPACP